MAVRSTRGRSSASDPLHTCATAQPLGLRLLVLIVLGVLRLADALQDNPEAIERILAAPGDAIRKAGLVAPLLLSFVVMLTLYNYNAWALALAVMALGMIRLDFNSKTLQTAGPASMPWYVLHHPLVVIFGYYIVRLGIGAIPAMLLLLLAVVIGTAALVAFVIAPWNPLRSVFGMPAARTKPQVPLSGAIAADGP